MQTGTSNAIVNAMLSWLKGLASWVLRLFNLAGGFSPLRFLANNWLKLLVLLLIVGLAGDLLIWLIRWRPHWVWFHKKRVIINDKNFFAGENELDDEDDWAGGAPLDWRDDDFVVTGAEHRRRLREKEEARRERERRERERAKPTVTDVFTDDSFDVRAAQRTTDRFQNPVFIENGEAIPEADAANSHAQTEPPAANRSAQRASGPHHRSSAPRRDSSNRR